MFAGRLRPAPEQEPISVTDTSNDSADLPVAIDAMGGDGGVPPNVGGAIEAAARDGVRTILVGDERSVREELAQQKGERWLETGMIAVRHAPEVVAMDEKPAVAVRQKKGSSMRVTCDLVNAGEACAALSAGNSGAMMAVALFVLKRIRGVIRPCIASPFPKLEGMGVLVDAGANIECTPEQLFQFGVMGEAFLRCSFDLVRPVVGVLSNGSEDSKGTELTREAKALLEKTDLNFAGYVEANHTAVSDVRVVVTDGFTGNIVLKTAEGAARFMTSQIRQGYERAGLFTKLGGLLSKALFDDIKAQNDPREYGAAPLLGLSHAAFIAHGNSDPYAMRRAIGAARRHTKRDVTAQIAAAVEQTLPLIQRPEQEAAG